MKAVILAGGGGTRLWPLSRRSRPKQFLSLLDNKTLLELTRLRVQELFSDEDIYYSVNRETAGFVKQIFPRVADNRLLVEPEKRDTGPAMGFVAAVLELSIPDEPIVFLPSDHYIRDHEIFQRTLRVADELIREQGCLVDIGVTPTWPNTNLGYTHIGEKADERNGVSIFAFLGHTEKPPAAEATVFVDSGEYLWHANYYMWTPRKFLEAYERHAPKTHATLRIIQEHWKKGDTEGIAREYATLEKISIDFAITEKLEPATVKIIKAPFSWSDVGSWSTVKQLEEENPKDNVAKGSHHVSIDTENCLIYGLADKVVATIGVKDIAIVDTGDALLVCDIARDQEIKLIIEELKARGLDRVL